jgi:pimeloyl-ACP methyl ester carboxylesterase
VTNVRQGGIARSSLARRVLVCLGALALAIVALGTWTYWREAAAPPFDPATTALHVVEIGDGPRKMVLIHGLAGSARYWTGRVESLRPDHALLIPDLLGFGQSPKPRARYDLDDHLAALEPLILHRGFDAGKALIVGHSLGAVIALGMVSRHPMWFEGTVLIGMPVFRDRAEAVARLGQHSVFFRGMLERDGLTRVSHYVRALWQWPWLAPLFGLPADVYLDAMDHTWNSLTGTLDATILGTDYRALMAGAATVPILFIHGQDDGVAPIEGARALAGQWTNARFVAVPGADHQLLLKQTDAVWSLVRAFEQDAS